jgi:hypothetical protein
MSTTTYDAAVEFSQRCREEYISEQEEARRRQVEDDDDFDDLDIDDDDGRD